MSSKRRTCSTLTKSAYHFCTTSAMTVDLRGFSISVMGSALWCLQNSMTFLRTWALTLGRGISVVSSSSPSSVGGKSEGEV